MKTEDILKEIQRRLPEAFMSKQKDKPDTFNTVNDGRASTAKQLQVQQLANQQNAMIQNAAIGSVGGSGMVAQNQYILAGGGSTGTVSVGGAGGAGFTGMLGGVSQGVRNPPPRFNPHDHDAYKIPLSVLVDLWRAKFQDSWVDLKAPITNDDVNFWLAGTERLEKNGKLEVHQSWARIREDA